MTRFVMSVKDSVSLVLDSAEHARGGEVFITKMPVVRIKDIAETMIKLLAPSYGFIPEDIKISVIGTKPGEKLYEELMSGEETRRSIELEKYFSVLPAFRGIYQKINYDYKNIISDTVSNPYNSSLEPAISTSEVSDFLDKHKLLQKPDTETTQRYWPGDKD